MRFWQKLLVDKLTTLLFSRYKSQETVKYLIGIFPQDVIIIISPGYGGRESVKHIVTDSGFLNKIFPGDVVMADRGFTIQEEVGFYQAKLVIPTFTKGKKAVTPPRCWKHTKNQSPMSEYIKNVSKGLLKLNLGF